MSFLLGLHSSTILGDQKEKQEDESDENSAHLEVPDEEPETTICLETLTIRFPDEKEFVKNLSRFLQETNQDCIELVSDPNHQPDESNFNSYVIPETASTPLPQNQRRILQGRLLDCLLDNRSCLNFNKQAMGYWYQDGSSGGIFIPSTAEQNDSSQEAIMNMFLGIFRNLLRLFLMLPEPSEGDREDASEEQGRPIFRSYRNELRRRAERRSRREQASNPYKRNRDRSRSPIRKRPKSDNSERPKYNER
ncbi:hypothetical protein [Endozoicomonas arenosclerae]|uniref:hypothetical protein n=1 Tax=Endozoicomonas arenosclerae TaxID=1633495 RepID=UPI000784CD9D|nr:hypothetical protein [Endozoicomonas arenosclerae]